jgi:uncharacterized protein YggU (UPF0235/DUF167 family)
MKISVSVKSKSKVEKVEAVGPWHFKVYVKAIPEKGKANEAVVAALAEFFKIPKAKIALRSGASSREKTFEIKV